MLIPKEAKLVYDGIKFRVYQWQQKMFDGTHKTFEGVKRTPSVQVIATHENKIIILEEEQPYVGSFVTIPGGMADFDESLENAAKRELKEETGLVTSNWEKFMEFQIGDSIDWKIDYFIARNCKKKFKQKLDRGEKINVTLVNFSEFIKISQQEDFRSRYLRSQIKKMSNAQLKEFKQTIYKT